MGPKTSLSMEQSASSAARIDRAISAKTADGHYPNVTPLVTLTYWVYVVTWYLQLGGRIDLLDTIRFEFLLAIVLIGFVLFYVPILRPSPLQRTILNTLWPFVICLGLGLLFSYNFETSWQVMTERLIKSAFFGIFVVAFVRGPTELKVFLSACLLAWLKIEQEAIMGILTGSMLWYNQGIFRLHGSTGMYAHPNNLAGLALGSLPFLYYLYPVVSRPLKIILAIQGFCALATIVYSGSRAGYLGLLFFILFLMKDAKNKLRIYAGVAVLVAVSFNTIPDQYWARFQTIQTGQEIDGASTEARKEIFDDAFEILKQHPFGVGVGAFPVVRWAYFGRNQDTHNLYLEVATNLGIQGLLAFLIFVYAMGKGLSYLKKDLARQVESLKEMDQMNKGDERKGHLNDLALMHAAVSAVLAFLLIRLVVGLFGHNLYEVYWWFVLGLTLALLNMNVWARQWTDRLLASRSEDVSGGAMDRRTGNA